MLLIGTFRFDYEYEIEFEYDFSNLVCVVQITACHTNLVSRVLLSAGKQQERVRVLKMLLICILKVVLVLNLVLIVKSEGP